MSGCRAFSWRLIDNFSVSIHRLIPLCSTFTQSVCRCRQKLPPFCIIGYAYVVCSEIRCCFRFFKFIGANTDCNQCANDHSRNKKGKNVRTAEFLFRFRDGDARFQLKADWGKWLENLLIRLSDKNEKTVTLKDLEIEFKACHFGSFDQFITTPLWQSLREHGLYLL